MNATERRKEIMKILCIRRYDTIGNLAEELGVSDRTVRRDIEILSLTEPIYTQSGRHRGGVYVMEGYYFNRTYLSTEEAALLNKIYNNMNSDDIDSLSSEELILLNNIKKKYTKPSTPKDN